MSLYRDIDTPQNPSLVTPFSAFHFIIGMYAYVVLKWLFPQFPLTYNFAMWFTAHGMYEVKDIFKPDTTNSAVNSFGDTIFSMAGFILAACIFPNRKYSLYEVMCGGVILLLAARIIEEPPTDKLL